MDFKEDLHVEDMFAEPEGFRPPPPKPTRHLIERDPCYVTENTPSSFDIQLVGHHTLWAHCLWNSGVFLGRYLDENKHLCKDKW